MDRKELRKRVTKSVTTETHDEIKEAWRKFGMIVLVVFGVLIFILLIIRVQRGLGSRTEDASDDLENEVSMTVLEERATASARGFLAGNTISAKANFVMDPRRVMPLMEKYYQIHEWDDRKFKDLVEERYHISGGREFVMGNALFTDGSKEFWVFEKTAEAEMRLQWEVAVGYSDKDWDQFIATKDTESGTFRVLLEYLLDDPYYNFDFDDPELYSCFILRVPGSERYVYGYLEKTSEAHKAFVAVRLMSELKSLPVIVKMRFLEKAHGEQVLIENIENFSWVPGVDM
jgi:hypothetical protein